MAFSRYMPDVKEPLNANRFSKILPRLTVRNVQRCKPSPSKFLLESTYPRAGTFWGSKQVPGTTYKPKSLGKVPVESGLIVLLLGVPLLAGLDHVSVSVFYPSGVMAESCMHWGTSPVRWTCWNHCTALLCSREGKHRWAPCPVHNTGNTSPSTNIRCHLHLALQ